MKVIGITGRAGSGKSLLSRLLSKRGAEVIDLDILGHEALEDSIQELRQVFGDPVIDSGKVDRKKLGEIVFSSKEKLDQLNNIIHPLIKEKAEHIIRTSGGKLAIIDGALIHQIGLDDICSYIVWVDCPEELAEERLLKRGMDRVKARKIIEAQRFLESYKKKCDLVLSNISTPEALIKQLDEVFASWDVVI